MIYTVRQDNYPKLYEALIPKAVLQGTGVVLVAKDDLAAVAPEVVKKAVQCPTCGIYRLDGLYKDYRDECGCISSYIHCRSCVRLTNEYFWELESLQTDKEKQKRFIDIHSTD